MARRCVTISLALSMDEDELRDGDVDFTALCEAVAVHVERSSISGLCPSLRPSAVANVGRATLEYEAVRS